MKDSYECARCGTEIPFSILLRCMWDKPQPDRCPRCGASHSVLRGEVSVISPVMLPIDAAGRVSPWMLGSTRPVVPGWYEFRFSDTEPDALRLWWNGLNVYEADGYARAVAMSTCIAWRGVWA